MEKPDTGEYIHWSETGQYNCSNCEQELFKSEHKVVDKIGYASFWTSVKNNIVLADKEEIKLDQRINNPFYVHMGELVKNSVKCSGCNSYIGALINDNTPPYFHKFCVNSVSVKFQEKEHFKDPIELKRQRTEEFERIKKAREWKQLTSKDSFNDE